MRTACSFSVAFTVAVFGLSQPVIAQESLDDFVIENDLQLDEDAQDAIGFRQGSFVAVPIPSQNPTFGTGLAVGAGYVFKADEKSSNSYFGIAGYGSSNGSRAYGLAAKVSLLENRWKFFLAAAEIDLNYDLIVFDRAIPLKQDGDLASATLSYGFTNTFSVGIGARYLATTVTPNIALPIPPEYIPRATTSIISAGVLADWDRRDDTFFFDNWNKSGI